MNLNARGALIGLVSIIITVLVMIVTLVGFRWASKYLHITRKCDRLPKDSPASLMPDG